MLSIIMLCVVMPMALMLSQAMFGVIALSVIMLSCHNAELPFC